MDEAVQAEHDDGLRLAAGVLGQAGVGLLWLGEDGQLVLPGRQVAAEVDGRVAEEHIVDLLLQAGDADQLLLGVQVDHLHVVALVEQVQVLNGGAGLALGQGRVAHGEVRANVAEAPVVDQHLAVGAHYQQSA